MRISICFCKLPGGASPLGYLQSLVAQNHLFPVSGTEIIQSWVAAPWRAYLWFTLSDRVFFSKGQLKVGDLGGLSQPCIGLDPSVCDPSTRKLAGPAQAPASQLSPLELV